MNYPISCRSVRLVLVSCLVTCAVAVGATASFGQNAEKKDSKGKKPVDLTLPTKDGFKIRCTYYPGGGTPAGAEKGGDEGAQKSGKTVVPIVLLHGFKGKRSDYERLATALQKLGHAVIVPDLRGHGQSAAQTLPNGKDVEIDPEKMRPNDFASMINDVVAVKRFLRTENNKELLNLEQLCVVGADMGAVLAMNWALYDWKIPNLPSYKAGRDIKAVVLLSPPTTFKGMNMNAAIAHPEVRSLLSYLVAVGEDDTKAFAEAKSIFNKLEKFHPGLEEMPAEERTMFFIPLKTELQGTNFFSTNSLPISQNIAQFIQWRLVAKGQRLVWLKRENPLETE